MLHKNDGVKKIILNDIENATTTNIDNLVNDMGPGSWAVRLVYNNRFGGVYSGQDDCSFGRMLPRIGVNPRMSILMR